MSELVHSKLYRRNRELEAEISTLKLELQGWQSAAAEYGLSTTDADATSTLPRGMPKLYSIPSDAL